MVFELNFNTSIGIDGKRVCYFFDKDLNNFKRQCPICVRYIKADNDKGLLYVFIDDEIAKRQGYNGPYALANTFRKLITEQETRGYIAWFEVHPSEEECLYE